MFAAAVLGAYNAEPVADIFDFFMLGEGEDSIHEVVESMLSGKRAVRKINVIILKQ